MFKKLFSLFAALTLSVGLWAAAPANAESVDLGLPSGLKWATFNVGATAPEGNGDYFAWGETEPYYADTTTDPITWKTGKETGYSWQSYCGASDFTEWNTAPYDATTNILKPEFDAATANWGSYWRMPTKEEYKELIANCTWTWTEDYNGTGINGYIVKSKAEGNTNSIFLPTAGFSLNGTSFYGAGFAGAYWSSSLSENNTKNAFYITILDSADYHYNYRFYGVSVRAVYVPAPVPQVSDQFVDTISNLMFEVTAVGETNTVKVINDGYTGTSYTIPATVKCNDVDFAVTEIGSVAFAGCSALQSIILPEGLTKIGYNAFGECSALESITIPASVTEIESYAFADCSGLISVTFLGNACQNAIGEEDAFLNVGKVAPALLTLPDNWTGSKPDEDGNWYGGKFELSDTALPTVKNAVKATKVMTNSQVILRQGKKNYTILGQEK